MPILRWRPLCGCIKSSSFESRFLLEMEDDMAIVLLARYYAREGRGDEVEAALHRMAPLVREREPGCWLYQVNRSRENRDHFLLYEQYADTAALEAHRETAHFHEIIEATIVPLLNRRERDLYDLVIG